MAAKHRILIAGASGVVGAAAVEHFASLPDWQVVALSRRPVRVVRCGADRIARLRLRQCSSRYPPL